MLRSMKFKNKDSGKLRIGDDWNAIRIIALSQSNPLKAIAGFVQNSIDAHTNQERQSTNLTSSNCREHPTPRVRSRRICGLVEVLKPSAERMTV